MLPGRRTAPPEAKTLARYLRSTLGGSPAIDRFWDENGERSVDVLSVNDTPWFGTTTCATLGLLEMPSSTMPDGMPLRVELIAATSGTECAELVASCAFILMNSDVSARPGLIVPDVVALHLPDSEQKHAMLVPPSFWELETQRLPTMLVTWLQLIPISHAERAFATRNGSDALEELLEEYQADVLDSGRASVL